MFAGSMALLNSIIGVYMLPVSTALGVPRGNFSFLLTIQGFVLLVALPFWGDDTAEVQHQRLLTIGVLTMVIGVFGFSISKALWQFYIFGGLTGIGIAATFTMATPFLINKWFAKKHRGKMLGIATAFSGVSTIFWSPLFTIIIQNFGWSTAYMINAALMAVLLLPWTIFVIKRSPEDKGLKPYGYVEGEEEETATGIVEKGLSAKAALKTPAFWILFFSIGFVAIGMGFNNNQSGIAKEFIGAAMDAKAIALVGASMISAAALGNLISKVLFGFVADRVKLPVTFLMFLAVWMIAYVIWLVFRSNTAALIAGGFCLGFCNAPSPSRIPACRSRTVRWQGLRQDLVVCIRSIIYRRWLLHLHSSLGSSTCQAHMWALSSSVWSCWPSS